MISLEERGSVMVGKWRILILHHLVLSERVTEAGVQLFAYCVFL